MPTPQPVPADGGPPDDPAAAELAAAQRDQPDDTDTPRLEHPAPESFPFSGINGSNT